MAASVERLYGLSPKVATTTAQSYSMLLISVCRRLLLSHQLVIESDTHVCMCVGTARPNTGNYTNAALCHAELD